MFRAKLRLRSTPLLWRSRPMTSSRSHVS